MTYCRWILAVSMAAVMFISASPEVHASALDRYYRMGDDAGEATSNGAAITNGGSVNVLTRDSQGIPGQAQLIHLGQVNTPTYRTVTGRPDGVGGFGIEFNAAQQEYLHNFNLNDPAASISFTDGAATLNYHQLFDRGLQFWVRPTSTAVQTLVMDSNQHGARINSNGKFSMRYAGVDYESSLMVAPTTWYHVEVVRPATFANGSRMFVNGVAVAAAPGSYNADSSHLVVGSNTAGTDTSFTGGTAEFFSGIIDDLKLFVIGQAPLCSAPTCIPDRAAVNYGAFNFATDNDYADFILTGVAGDLNHSGSLTQADKDAFIAGWMNKKVINGIQIGDLQTFGQGDLNFDGITNIFDLALMQNALTGSGFGAITEAELRGVGIPEPTAFVPVLWALVGLTWCRFHRY